MRLISNMKYYVLLLFKKNRYLSKKYLSDEVRLFPLVEI